MRWPAILGGIALLSFVGGKAALTSARLALRTGEKAPVVTLPFEYFRKHILVTMQINDSGPHVCMVDNGFNADVITESAARAMALPVHAMGGKTPNAEGFGESSGPETFVVEKTVTLGMKDLPILTGQAYVLDMAGFEDGMGVHFDCVLGLPLFAHYVVEIDFAKRQLMLYDPRGFESVSYTHLDVYKRQVPYEVFVLDFFQRNYSHHSGKNRGDPPAQR